MLNPVMNLDADVMPQAQAKRKKSAGERVFDRVVYTGIGFGVNEASSLWITDQFLNGKNLLENVPVARKAGAWFSKEGFDRASGYFAKAFKLTERVVQEGGKTVTLLPRERAGNSILMATLLSGGTLLVWPMKLLEDHKAYWVKKANHVIDRWRGNKLTAEEVAARDDKVENDIACSPRQSWPTMLMGRAAAMFASWGTGTFLVGAERNKRLMEWSEKGLTGSLQPEGQRNAAHRYARLASVETYSCAVSSGVLELSSKFCAKRGIRRHDAQRCVPGQQDAMQDNKAAGSHSGKVRQQRDADEPITARL